MDGGLLSVRACPGCRLGGGAGFRSVEVGFGTGVEDECEALGGVGGRGDGMTSTSGSMSSSGILPAASRSKMLSLSSSTDCLAGAGGRGLLISLDEGRSVGEATLMLPCPDDPGLSAAGVSLRPSSLLSSILISFPCREPGGGGGFFFDAGGGGLAARASSSSGSDISWDVRGVSCGRCAESNMDCRDIEDASVILPPSPATPVGCRWDGEEAAGLDTAAGTGPWPVNSSLLNASTSMPPFAAAVPCSPSFALRSISSKVFWKGFGGACPMPTGCDGGSEGCSILSSPRPTSSAMPGGALLKGSSRSVLRDSLLLVLSSSSLRFGRGYFG